MRIIIAAIIPTLSRAEATAPALMTPAATRTAGDHQHERHAAIISRWWPRDGWGASGA